MRPILRLLVVVFTLLVSPAAWAQSTTYHLHIESWDDADAANQLLATGPDAPAALIRTTLNLRNEPPSVHGFGVPLAHFKGAIGDHGVGVIPVGTVVTFSFWMRKTTNAGTLHPFISMSNGDDPGRQIICNSGSVFGLPPLTTTLTKYVVNCTVSQPITMTATNFLNLGVAVYVAVTPKNKNVWGELHLEGVLNGNYDSTVVVPNTVPE